MTTRHPDGDDGGENELLRRRERALGPDHPDVAMSRATRQTIRCCFIDDAYARISGPLNSDA